MPSARKSAPPKAQAKAKRTAVPHGPSEGKGKPAASKAPAKATTAPAMKPAARTTRGGAAASTRRERNKPNLEVFIAEYKVDRNGKRAAIAAGYSPKTAAAQASRLLTDVNVRAEVDSHRADVIAKVQQETGITLERTLREIARIGYFDPRRMFKSDGTPLGVHELDDDTAAVVAGLEVLEAYEGTGDERQKIGQIKKWKLADKKGALDMLMKHLGGYKADNDQAGEATAKALIAGLTVRFVEPGQA